MKNLCFVILLVINSSVFSQHTFSICAVDPVTGEVGSAGASCISNSIVISDVHPGVGVVHTQAYFIPANKNYASDLMDSGVSPADIIDSLMVNDINGDTSLRQYGIVDLVDGGRTAAFTGSECLDWKGHILGSTYSIQGNILLGPEILDGMEAEFLNTEGNLACKLMAALQGAKIPGADIRCDSFNISSLSSFLRVAQSTDSKTDLWLDLEVKEVEGDSGIDPIDSLQTLFDAIGGCNYTDVNEINNNFTPTVYPQPTVDRLIFDLDGRFTQIEIFDLSGNQIYSADVTNDDHTVIDTHLWDAGIYMYSLFYPDGRTATGKLIIQ